MDTKQTPLATGTAIHQAIDAQLARTKTLSAKSALPWIRKMGRVSGITAGSSRKERQAIRDAQAQAIAALESLRGAL